MIVSFYTDNQGFRRLNTFIGKVCKPQRILRRKPPYRWDYRGSHRYANTFYADPYIERNYSRKAHYVGQTPFNFLK